MTLPKTLSADLDYPDDIRDEHYRLLASVYARTDGNEQEVRDAIVQRWNAHDAMRNTLLRVLDSPFEPDKWRIEVEKALALAEGRNFYDEMPKSALAREEKP